MLCEVMVITFVFVFLKKTVEFKTTNYFHSSDPVQRRSIYVVLYTGMNVGNKPVCNVSGGSIRLVTWLENERLISEDGDSSGSSNAANETLLISWP